MVALAASMARQPRGSPYRTWFRAYHQPATIEAVAAAHAHARAPSPGRPVRAAPSRNPAAARAASGRVLVLARKARPRAAPRAMPPRGVPPRHSHRARSQRTAVAAAAAALSLLITPQMKANCGLKATTAALSRATAGL